VQAGFESEVRNINYEILAPCRQFKKKAKKTFFWRKKMREEK